MKIYDISQELLSSCVYPGDPAPERKQIHDISRGDMANLSTVFLCAHNGTHVDAPYHFYQEGKTIDQLDLERLIGEAYVYAFEGVMTGEDVERLMGKDRPQRVLLKGNVLLTADAARALNEMGILLLGVEAQSVDHGSGPKEVHLELLKKEVVLLEGIRLEKVPEGRFLLNAAPLNLGGSDGAPCRAVLLEGVPGEEARRG